MQTVSATVSVPVTPAEVPEDFGAFPYRGGAGCGAVGVHPSGSIFFVMSDERALLFSTETGRLANRCSEPADSAALRLAAIVSKLRILPPTAEGTRAIAEFEKKLAAFESGKTMGMVLAAIFLAVLVAGIVFGLRACSH
jgi:hypothetical protein